MLTILHQPQKTQIIFHSKMKRRLPVCRGVETSHLYSLKSWTLGPTESELGLNNRFWVQFKGRCIRKQMGSLVSLSVYVTTTLRMRYQLLKIFRCAD